MREPNDENSDHKEDLASLFWQMRQRWDDGICPRHLTWSQIGVNINFAELFESTIHPKLGEQLWSLQYFQWCISSKCWCGIPFHQFLANDTKSECQDQCVGWKLHQQWERGVNCDILFRRDVTVDTAPSSFEHVQKVWGMWLKLKYEYLYFKIYIYISGGFSEMCFYWCSSQKKYGEDSMPFWRYIYIYLYVCVSNGLVQPLPIDVLQF